MSRKPKNHIKGLLDSLASYAEENSLQFNQYSPYHMRLMDGGYTVLDAWTTGRYYVLTTDYLALTDGNIGERGGEKGQLPIDKLEGFLDNLFFTGDGA